MVAAHCRYAKQGDVTAAKRIWARARNQGLATGVTHKLALEALMQAWCNEGRTGNSLQEALEMVEQGKQLGLFSEASLLPV